MPCYYSAPSPTLQLLNAAPLARASAETRFFPCWITGHTLACILAIFASFLVLHRFKQRLLQMRVGDNPYQHMLQTTPISKFSFSSAPALGGMVSDGPSL